LTYSGDVDEGQRGASGVAHEINKVGEASETQERTATATSGRCGEEGDDANGGHVLNGGGEGEDATARVTVTNAVGRRLLGAND
jgi:hypothetical protein